MLISDPATVCPQQVGNVKIYDLFDEVVLYSQTLDMAFSLNSTAKAIWELCDGNRSVEKISYELSQQFDGSETSLLSDIDRTVKLLHQHGLLQLIDMSHASVTKTD
jgi:hypothetical protein